LITVCVAGLALVVAGCGASEQAVDTAAPEEPAEEAPAEPAESAPEPSVDAEPALFEPLILEGTGDDVVTFPAESDRILVAKISYSGGSNFVVRAFAEGGSPDLLVNTIGAYEGTRPLNFEAPVGEFEIKASGPWTITISDFREQPEFNGSASGSGDQVLRVPNLSGPMAVSYAGESNFVVRSWGSSTDLLVNTIDAYSGTVRMGETAALEIVSSGPWTLDLG
jgi:hypothetical protein